MGRPNNAKPCGCGHLKGAHRLVTVSRRDVRLNCLNCTRCSRYDPPEEPRAP